MEKNLSVDRKKKKSLSSFFFFSGFLLIMNGKFSETAGGIGCRLILCVAAKCLDSRPLLLLSTIRAIGIIKPAPFSLSSDEGSIHTHTPHTRRKERNLAGAGDTMSGLHLQTSDLLIFYFFFFSFTRKKERFRLSRINNVLARQWSTCYNRRRRRRCIYNAHLKVITSPPFWPQSKI